MCYTNFLQDYKIPQLRTASRPAVASNSAGGFFYQEEGGITRSFGGEGRRQAAGSTGPNTFQQQGKCVPPAGAARAKPKRRSPLPDWYPRTPLRDITPIIKVTYFPRLYGGIL
jgi:hypothetical protein